MSVILDKYELFYAAVPKVACTSVKSMFFVIENGRHFEPYTINGRPKHIHNIGYPSNLREDYPDKRIATYHRVALVRDPVKRFLSAYGNRVLHHKELSMDKAGLKLKKLGLEPTPDLGLFVDKHAEYLEAHPSILHHTRPMIDYLGEDAGYFSKLYPLEDINQFVKDISEHVEMEVEIGREQTGGKKIKPSDLTEAQTQKIKDYYESDYRVFGDYF
jgi:sulfotransferase famil protein